MSKDRCDDNHNCPIDLLEDNSIFEDIKEMVKQPKYICFNCGRVAEYKENLCNPEKYNN